MAKRNQIPKGEIKSSKVLVQEIIEWTCKTVRSEMDFWEKKGYVINRATVEQILDSIIEA